jgi:DNA processing protein
VEKSLKDYKYWLCLGRNVRFTAALFQEIYAIEPSIERLFMLSESELKALNLSERCLREFINSRQQFTPERVLAELTGNQIEPVFIFEDDYPELLKQIYDPPFILYKKGNASLDQLCVGVVGSRRPTDYGTQVTEKFAGELAANGVCVVSGLAIGIDTIAHSAALAAGGQTLAVIGCGLDQIYPSRNVMLAKEIIKNGAIVSEFPYGTAPLRQNFPARNRIISGISQGLLVTEAAAGSGSLITAKAALDQNREVFAVPGNIFNLNSAGTNSLIAAGAHITTSTKDIFDEFGITNPDVVVAARKVRGKNETEVAIIRCLESEPKHIDILVKETTLPQSEISAAVTMMEISAKIKHLGGNVFRLNT